MRLYGWGWLTSKKRSTLSSILLYGARFVNWVCNQSTLVSVLAPSAAEKYLGRKLCADCYHETELDNRIAMGWAAFFKTKAVLCNRRLRLGSRMKLFESTVTPCVIYAGSTWSMTLDMERGLRSTRRRMLRWMVGVARRSEEDWPDYMRRSTHGCEALAERHGTVDWVVLQRRRKWVFAGRCASKEDGRWSQRLLAWKPWFRCVPFRSVGRPMTRWDDDIAAFARDSWTESACCRALWLASSEGYVRRFA